MCLRCRAATHAHNLHLSAECGTPWVVFLWNDGFLEWEPDSYVNMAVVSLTAHCWSTNCWNIDAGIILGMGSADERRRYNVTSSLIGWTHAQNDQCKWNVRGCRSSNIFWKIEIFLVWELLSILICGLSNGSRYDNSKYYTYEVIVGLRKWPLQYIYVCVENSKYGCEVDILMIIYVFKNDVYIMIIDIDNGYMQPYIQEANPSSSIRYRCRCDALTSDLHTGEGM